MVDQDSHTNPPLKAYGGNGGSGIRSYGQVQGKQNPSSSNPYGSRNGRGAIGYVPDGRIKTVCTPQDTSDLSMLGLRLICYSQLSLDLHTLRDTPFLSLNPPSQCPSISNSPSVLTRRKCPRLDAYGGGIEHNWCFGYCLRR